MSFWQDSWGMDKHDNVRLTLIYDCLCWLMMRVTLLYRPSCSTADTIERSVFLASVSRRWERYAVSPAICRTPCPAVKIVGSQGPGGGDTPQHDAATPHVRRKVI